jgi:ribosomal-protein-alanine N-acetyltransferase
MQLLATARLSLEPLVAAHAAHMFAVLCEPAVHRYLDHGPPPSLAHLQSVYARLEARRSPDGSEAWLNWVVVPHGDSPVGFVQATVAAGQIAWVGYLLATRCWGRGYATEAMQGMLAHLAACHGVGVCQATVEAENLPSVRLLERLSFHRASSQELQGHELSPSEILFIKRLEAQAP